MKKKDNSNLGWCNLLLTLYHFYVRPKTKLHNIFFIIHIHQNHCKITTFSKFLKRIFLNKLCLCSQNTALKFIISHLMEVNGKFINEVLAYFDIL